LYNNNFLFSEKELGNFLLFRKNHMIHMVIIIVTLKIM